MLRSSVLCLGLSLGLANGHFLLKYPTSLGFDEDKSPDGPCGGFDVTFNNATDFYVDKDAIAVQSTHPSPNWLFRVTLDSTASGNWSELLPVVSQSGLGNFCEAGVK